MGAILDLRDVCKRYGRRHAVRNLSFSARPGTVTGLIGPNGAGKTTTMRMILDIIRPDSGSIDVFSGIEPRARRRRTGYLPEERGLYPKMEVLAAVAYFAELHGLKPAAAVSAARTWLGRLDLADRAAVAVESLSKGLAQRVQLAAALAHDPELVILDEPMSGLDPIAADLLRDVIVDLAREGRTVLLSTHDLEQAERLCSEMVMIAGGRVVLAGETNAMKSEYGRRTVAIFFDGDLSFLRTHPAVANLSIYGTFADIELKPESDPQALFDACAGRVRVHRFEVTSPSLAEIFRRKIAQMRAAGEEITLEAAGA